MKIKVLAICALLSALALAGCTNAPEKPFEPTTAKPEATAAEASTAPALSDYYSADGFTKDENGFYSYSDDTTISKKGIDVSSYSGDIDWKKVADCGVEFAIIRVGGRGYGDEGALYTDENVHYNLEKARENGIEVGAYFYSQATSVAEAEEEAEFVLSIIAENYISMPVAYDFEHIKDDTARTDNISDAQAREFADAFCAKLEAQGYSTAVYHEYGDSLAAERAQWVAEYDKIPELSRGVLLWQYSRDGKVDGIEGNVDLDIMFEKRN